MRPGVLLRAAIVLCLVVTAPAATTADDETALPGEVFRRLFIVLGLMDWA